jgi:biotin synthase
MPISMAILPANTAQVAELLEAGVDRIGLGLDAACERVFKEFKGPHWDYMLTMIESSAERFPGVASVHLMVGLGETERELVERMLWIHDLGLSVSLFAFTPVRGTSLSDRPQPALSQYRRIQIARWLIIHHRARMTSFGFNAWGALAKIRFGAWRAVLADGEAFRTAGCPACNRPFYNERPGGTIYNYARPLTAQEALQAVRDAELEG